MQAGYLFLILVMRSEGTLKLLLNVKIFSEMVLILAHSRNVSFSAFQEGNEPTKFLLKFKSQEEAEEFKSQVEDKIKNPI